MGYEPGMSKLDFMRRLAKVDRVDIMPLFADGERRVWRVPVVSILAEKGVEPKKTPDIAGWILESPSEHVAHSYLITLIRLRPPEGGSYESEPLIVRPGATHEIMVHGIAPVARRMDIIEGIEAELILPVHYCGQLICDSDGAAIGEVEELLRTAVVDGDTDPSDSEWWIDKLGDHMIDHEAEDGDFDLDELMEIFAPTPKGSKLQ